MRAVDIQWETDGEPCVDLPDEMQIPDHIRHDGIADYLSDETGWLVNGFQIQADEHILSQHCALPFKFDGLSGAVCRLTRPEDLIDVCRVLYDTDPNEDGLDSERDMLKNAAYPCWVLFAHHPSDPGQGQFLGPVQAIIDELNGIMQKADAEAREA